jgi:hypothetical protein
VIFPLLEDWLSSPLPSLQVGMGKVTINAVDQTGTLLRINRGSINNYAETTGVNEDHRNNPRCTVRELESIFFFFTNS